jgi:hypothetical protein
VNYKLSPHIPDLHNYELWVEAEQLVFIRALQGVPCMFKFEDYCFRRWTLVKVKANKKKNKL